MARQIIGKKRGGMRRYLQTHPWLTFDLNLERAGPNLWIKLGEAQSKCQHLADIPLKPNIAEYLHQIYLAKGAFATTAIEGNTLTELEVRDHLAGKLKLPPSREYLTVEIDNIVEAFNSVLKKIKINEHIKLSLELFSFFNKTILNNLELEERVRPGQIRSYSVGVGPYKAAPYEDCEYLIDELCDWLNSKVFTDLQKQNSILYGLVKAVVAHLYFVWIHPFGDGNGRTARLIETTILMQSGVPSTAAHLLSNHYNLTRQKYYQSLDQSSKNGGNIIPFLEYAVSGFVEQLSEHIQIVKVQQIHVAWVNYVHDYFSNKNRKSDNRRKMLLLAISSSETGYVQLDEVRGLNPKIATEYAKVRSDKTIARDLEVLCNYNLLEKTSNGYRALVEQMMAFLPTTNPELDIQLTDSLLLTGRQLALFDHED